MKKKFASLIMLFLSLFFLRADLKSPNKITPVKDPIEVYKQNRQQNIGNYITADAVLSIHNLVIQKAIAESEEKFFLPSLKKIVNATYEKLISCPKKQTPCQYNLAYFAVAKALLEGSFPKNLPPEVKKLASQELSLIKSHSAIRLSPITGIKEDYTQYKPRGRYTKSAELSRYFQVVMLFSRQGFYIVPTNATGLTPEHAKLNFARALQLSEIFAQDKQISAAYKKILSLQRYLIGQSDDLPITFLSEKKITEKELLLKTCRANKLLPKIISIPIQKSLLPKDLSPQEAALALKILPSYYTVDSHIYQLLVFSSVGEYQGNPQKLPFTAARIGTKVIRAFPTIYDLLALFSYSDAKAQLQRSGDSAYKGYSTKFAQAEKILQKHIHNPTNLYIQTLKTLKILQFYNPDLTPAVAFYGELRHNYILYAKQSYTLISKGLAFETRQKADIDPYPLLYRQLAIQAEEMAKKLPFMKETLKKYSIFLKNLATIAEARLTGELNPKHIAYLNSFDTKVEEILGSLSPSPVVVDIHTDPNTKQALYIATGFALYTHKGLRGVRYVAYQFKKPLRTRLTDEQWEKIFLKGSPEGEI